MTVILAVTDENGTHITHHGSESEALRALRANYADGDDVPGWDSEDDELVSFVETQGVRVEIIDMGAVDQRLGGT